MNAQRKMHNAKRWLGFTLIEVVVSMLVTSILVAGMASTIYVTTRANDASKGPLPGSIEGARAAQVVAGDLQLAQTISARTANSVTFTVADRDGNVTPDTIKYTWSGTPGDPLTVQYNGGATTNLVSDVRECSFTYKTQTVSKSTSSQTTVNSGETLLASWSQATWSGGGTAMNPGRKPTTLAWNSECFTLNAPSTVSNLQITRVRIWMKKNLSGSGNTTLGFYSASGSGPYPGSIIGSLATKANSALTTSYAPIDFLFTDVPITSVTSAYNIVIKGTSSTAGSDQQCYQNGTVSDSSIMKYTDNSGVLWSPILSSNNAFDFPFEVYGSYDSTQTVNTTTNRYFVRGVSLKLRVGGDTNSAVQTSALVLNSPEVTSP